MPLSYPLLIIASIAATSKAAGNVLSSLSRAHWLLHASEEIHRSFRLLHNVQVLHMRASSDPPQLCVTSSLSSVTVSRRQYEESWTTVYAADVLEAVFNGKCFATSPGMCADYTRCENLEQAYPEERDPVSGLQQFKPEVASLQAMEWAMSQAKVQAWQNEQAELLRQLETWPQDSEQASYLRLRLIAAAGSVDLTLRTENHALAQLAAHRATAFKTSVDPETATPPKVSGSPVLPQSIVTLAAAIQSLVRAILESPCSPDTDWTGLRQQVSVGLQEQADALNDIDAGSLLQPVKFDYTWRVSEALLVGVSLSLQCAVLSVLAEFECDITTNPRSTTVSSLEALRQDAHQLLEQLSEALPEPIDISAGSMPLQRCFARRIAAVRDAISEAAAGAGALTPSLLSLDFCERLFQATANQVIKVSPYTESAPSASDMQLFAASSEERRIYFDANRRLAYVDPYARIVERPTAEDGTKFATNDKVIQLRAVEGANVREAARVTPERPCIEFNSKAIDACDDQPPCQPGCYEEAFGTMCAMAKPGLYAADGQQELLCPGGRQLFLSAHFYMSGWPNSSCPFVCKAADFYQNDGRCESVHVGFHSPVCSNSKIPCATPTGMPSPLFHALVTPTSAGHGSPLGCELTLAFPFVLTPPAVRLTAPFTIEMFVKVAVRDIPSTSSEAFAILAGVFPFWFVALRRASEKTVQIAFYHATITRAPSSRQDSLVDSETIPWSNTWRHLAVVVKSTHAFAPNIEFYCDGSLVSSARRTATVVDMPLVPFTSFQVFHVGPPNVQLFPGVLEAGRREPYFNTSGTHLYYHGELDEIRVHNTALSGLALGVHLTELRQHVACNVPSEALEGSTCRPAARLIAAHTTPDRFSCQTGFETCAAHPGMCVAQCKSGMLKQPDCTCECPSGEFQVWFVKGIQLRGSGMVRNITVFDAKHRVVAQDANKKLDWRVQFEIATRVAVLTVRGGGSATTLSVYVETAADDWLPVPAYQNIELLEDRDIILHHRRLHEFSDASFECAICPGHALGSMLPRLDALACTCVEDYGRSLLGRCEARRGALPIPLISPETEFHTAGTRVRLSLPALDVEGPWLTEIHYELGVGKTPDAPSCLRSAKYIEEDGQEPGLDIIKRLRTVTVRAVLCHPLHYDSPVVDRTFTGNDHLDPPRCAPAGVFSTQTTYALHVNVTLTVDNEPDARILYRLGDGADTEYLGPIVISDPGDTVVQSWATKNGFDTSMMTACRYSVDGVARVVTKLKWVDSSEPQIAGFIQEERGFLVRRGLQQLSFMLMPEVPGGGKLAEPVSLQYRLLRKPFDGEPVDMEQFGDWQHVSRESTVSLNVESLLWASQTTTVMRVEWKAQEKGFVWSSLGSIQLILLATRTPAPAIEVTPAKEWGMGDHWTTGPLREAALRQVHHVEIRKPTSEATLVFTVGEDSPGTLVEASAANASSVRNGGLVQRLAITAWSHEWGPDELATGCGQGSDSLPRLCYYVGRFAALAGVTIQAFALQAGLLESTATILKIAKRQDPERGQASFQAAVEMVGPRFPISSLKNVFVLPSHTESFQFSLGLNGLERQSCVLLSTYVHDAENRSSSGLGAYRQPEVDDCQWLPYKGQRMLERSAMYESLGMSALAARSLNVTVLTSVRRPGYLWAYPYATQFLWLRDRTSAPSIIGVVAPGTVPMPAAMVWLQELRADVNEARAPSCYFSVSHMPIPDADLQLGWLQVVPELSAPVPTIHDAMQPTELLKSAKKANAWLSDLNMCTWPSVCELPLDGPFPAELIQAPAALPWVCAWVTVPGLSESVTKCARIEMSEAKFVRPAFTADEATDVSKVALLRTNQVVKVGEDADLGAIVVIIGSQPTTSVKSERQLSTSASALTLILERSHPLQYRFASVAASPESLSAGASQLLSDASFSHWQDLGAADPAPQVPLPVSGKDWPAEHAFFAVDVRLMVGINSWSEQARSFCIALQGRHPALQVQQSNRTIFLKSSRNGTILYRWSIDGANKALDEIYSLQGGFKSIQDAYKLDPGVAARVQPPGTLPQDCTAPTGNNMGSDELKAEVTVGPRFCSVQASADGAAVQLPAPDSRRWTLWAAIYSPGLAMSPSVSGVVEAQCAVPDDVLYAESLLCLEGSYINSGQLCHVQCQQGYTPSESTLQCRDGAFHPWVISCIENPCSAHLGIESAQDSPCVEGHSISSGGYCTSHCPAGFVASVSSRLCEKGTFFPANFTCIEAPCTAPLNILQGANPSCTGLESIASGDSCIPQCQPGYMPSQSTLQCYRGKLSPSSFQCNESPCAAPSGIRYAGTPPCVEGHQIDPQGICQPRCQSGFAPSELMLTCNAGVLQPSTFACDEIPCSAPANITNGHTPPCKEGQRIRPGDACTARCLQGFAPTHSHLTCSNGSLLPSAFQCTEKEKEDDIFENVLLIAVIVGVIALLGMCVLAGAVMWMRRNPIVNINVDDADFFEEWPEDVKAVAPGTCVFCMTNPAEVQGIETTQSPPTLVKCCSHCAQVLPIRIVDPAQGCASLTSLSSMMMPTGSVVGTPHRDNLDAVQRTSLLESMPRACDQAQPRERDWVASKVQEELDMIAASKGRLETGDMTDAASDHVLYEMPANSVHNTAGQVVGRPAEQEESGSHGSTRLTGQPAEGARTQTRSRPSQHMYPNLLNAHEVLTSSKKNANQSSPQPHIAAEKFDSRPISNSRGHEQKQSRRQSTAMRESSGSGSDGNQPSGSGPTTNSSPRPDAYTSGSDTRANPSHRTAMQRGRNRSKSSRHASATHSDVGLRSPRSGSDSSQPKHQSIGNSDNLRLPSTHQTELPNDHAHSHRRSDANQSRPHQRSSSANVSNRSDPRGAGSRSQPRPRASAMNFSPERADHAYDESSNGDNAHAPRSP